MLLLTDELRAGVVSDTSETSSASVSVRDDVNKRRTPRSDGSILGPGNLQNDLG